MFEVLDMQVQSIGLHTAIGLLLTVSMPVTIEWTLPKSTKSTEWTLATNFTND